MTWNGSPSTRSLWLAGLVLVGVLLAFQALRFALVFRAVRRTPFVQDRVALVPVEAIPEQERAILQADADALTRLGFVAHAALAIEMRTETGPVTVHGLVYEHPPTRTYVTLRANREAWIKLACLGDFANYTADGRHIETASHALYAVPSLPRRVELEAPLVPTIEARWELHRARLAGLAQPCLSLSPTEGVARMRAFFGELAAHLRALGWLREHRATGELRYTLRGAWAVTRAALAEMRRWQRFRPAEASPLSPAQAALAFEHAAAQAPSQRLGRLGKLALLLASAALFSLSFGAVFSWELVPVLLLVLLLHEGGHWLAMKWLGYRDLSVYFLPLLGAATVGHKPEARPLQKVAVYLAGPVPGLVLGLAAGYASLAFGSTSLFTFAIVALVLNWLNLLPIAPLDGGRILEVLWLERLPRARVGFLLASGLLFATLSDVLLGILAAVVLLFVPGEWRFARLIGLLRADRQGANPLSLPQVFARLMEVYPKTQPMAQHAIAKRALEAFDASPPGLATALAGSLLYLASLALPLAFAAALMVGTIPLPTPLGWAPSAAQKVAPDWETDLHTAASPEARWQVLTDAGHWHLERGDATSATAFFTRALGVAEALPDGWTLRVRSHFARASAAEAPEPALADYRALVGLLTETDEETVALKAEALERITDLDPGLTPAERADLYAQALALYPASAEASGRLALLRVGLAQLLDANGQPVQAEQVLRAGLLASTTGQAPDAKFPTVVVQLAWFLIAQDRSDEAVTLLEPYAAAVAGVWPLEGEVLTALAWAHLASGPHERALATLETIPAPPSLWPFGKAEPPLSHELDRAACLKAADDPGLEAALQALAERLAQPQARPAYLALSAQRLQLEPWQARRSRAHQEVLRALEDRPPRR